MKPLQILKHAVSAAVVMLVVCSFVACTSEPQWADPEAHEKTEQLQRECVPLMIGTWHYEVLGDKHRFFERLTFKADNTFTGYRKWQSRSLVTVDGQEVYTDWKDIEEECGAFTGSWQLYYGQPIGGGEKRNLLSLRASFDDKDKSDLPYSSICDFGYVDTATLCFQGFYFADADGWTAYSRGEAESSF